MRGKRSKQYRKLLERYAIAFGFREPYQIIGALKSVLPASNSSSSS